MLQDIETLKPSQENLSYLEQSSFDCATCKIGEFNRKTPDTDESSKESPRPKNKVLTCSLFLDDHGTITKCCKEASNIFNQNVKILINSQEYVQEISILNTSFEDLIDPVSRTFLSSILNESELKYQVNAKKTISFLLNNNSSPSLPTKGIWCRFTRIKVGNCQLRNGLSTPCYGYEVKARYLSNKSTQELKNRLEDEFEMHPLWLT